jgi:2-(3-amino-3-carboxypropyl)histidine synthase
MENTENQEETKMVHQQTMSELQEQQDVLWKKHSLNAALEQRLKTEHSIDCESLMKACSILPWNYNYEVPKTIDKILTCKKQQKLDDSMKISLQFPEGLLLHSTFIADIISKFCKVESMILGDVTYGACCVDDIASKQLGCDFIVHYGHSCLVSIPDMVIQNALYVFVEIKFDVDIFVESIDRNFADYKDKPVMLMGIIQFNNSLLLTKAMLEK